MGLTALSLLLGSGGQPSAPLRADRVTFKGDDAYPGAAGTAGISAKLAVALPLQVATVVDVIGRDATGQYALQFDQAADTLVLLDMSATPPASLGAGDQSAIVFEATILSK